MSPTLMPGFGADIVHAGLVKTAFGEANHRGLQDLRGDRWAISVLGRHLAGTDE